METTTEGARAELWGMWLSPWTEKARWALDHHKIAYKFRVYTPMLDELGLRARLRRPFGKVSVPALFAGGARVNDSFQIARYADKVGAGAKLTEGPGAHDVYAWNDRSETAMSAGRALKLPRLVTTPGAAREMVPSFVPEALRDPMSKVSALGVSYVAWKYGAAGAAEGSRAALEATLVALRAALGGRPYLLDAFSFADIAMAATIHSVRPVDHAAVRIGPATREAFTDPELVAAFPDLLAWRDALYAKHRGA